MILYLGDCLDVMAGMEENSISSIVTDPPYGLSFMGRGWDHGVPGVEFWAAALRVSRPGAMMLAFGGTRTHHRLMVAIEDAGWEIRDCLMWLYGSGMPKGLDISKAIDKAAGAEREVVGEYVARGFSDTSPTNDGRNQWAAGAVSDKVGLRTVASTDAAKQWDGWNTNLKPAWEPIIMARKPLSEPTVAANVLKWGTGGINVDASRIEGVVPQTTQGASSRIYGNGKGFSPDGMQMSNPHPQGRWPANLLLDEEAAVLLDKMSGVSKSVATRRGERHGAIYGNGKGPTGPDSIRGHEDQGGASRFFYVAKASKKDRGEGNNHPTVKPTSLMQWLCRLVTPVGGTILDPFMGSGSTGKAAQLEGFDFVGIDKEQVSFDIATQRLAI